MILSRAQRRPNASYRRGRVARACRVRFGVRCIRLWLGLCLLAPTALYGADRFDLFEVREDSGLFVRLSGKAWLNVGVEIETVGPVYGPGEFADGFVKPDAGGSPDQTWNWGYDSGSQIQSDQLQLERYEGVPSLAEDIHGVASGGELMAGLELLEFRMNKRRVRLGVEVGYGFNYLSVDTGKAANATVTYTRAAYNLNGVRSPMDPAYSGSFEGPGPLIGLMPAASNSVTAADGRVTSDGELNAGLHNFKFGVWMDYPITESLFTSLSLGYSSIYADAQFEFTDVVSSGSGVFPTSTTATTLGGRDNWKPGFYVQWRLDYELSRRVDLFLGVDYQWNDKLSFSGAGQQVTLDFSAMVGASLGLQLNF